MREIIKRLFLVRNQSACISIGRNFSYASDLSLDKLYPNSRLQLHTPPPLQSINSDGKFSGYIPIDQLDIKYSRSSGPGGQNVNRVDTKVDLRFHVQSASWLTTAVKEKFTINYKNQINKEGYFVIRSDVTRYQHLNLADALERVRNIIRLLEGLEKAEPSEESQERAKKLREKAARNRLIEKRHKSVIKADRRDSFKME